MKRSSGVLLHISSLPGKYGIGSMGAEAKRFADFCHQAGLGWWQVLPIGPTGYGNSPYQSDSVFAGNPNLINLEQLIEEGLLEETECERKDWGKDQTRVCFDKVSQAKQELLHKAFLRARENPEYWSRVEKFYQQEKDWLDDYALYLALKEKMGNKSWQEWKKGIRFRQTDVLKHWKEELQEQMQYPVFVQYLFYSQWEELKVYCNRKGVRLIGDIPIYVAQDSCDTWVNRSLFEYDEQGYPIRVAGCPPDYFSKTGQLWGNPLYRWDVMEKDGYRWWIQRIRAMSRLFDLTRIDHFRGFAGYYAIDAKAKTAEHGKWEKGPGEKLFRAIKKELPGVSLIAEDLGVITEDVCELRDRFGFPGMKVLQFAFSAKEESDYLPHNCPKRAVIYTGTHDNDTSLGWMKTAPKEEVLMAKNYLGVSGVKGFSQAMIRAAWVSPCELAIAPMQDFLGLDSSARMNTPSTVGGNWEWRMEKDAASPKLAKEILMLNQASWRKPVYKKTVKARLK